MRLCSSVSELQARGKELTTMRDGSNVLVVCEVGKRQRRNEQDIQRRGRVTKTKKGATRAMPGTSPGVYMLTIYEVCKRSKRMPCTDDCSSPLFTRRNVQDGEGHSEHGLNDKASACKGWFRKFRRKEVKKPRVAKKKRGMIPFIIPCSQFRTHRGRKYMAFGGNEDVRRLLSRVAREQLA